MMTLFFGLKRNYHFEYQKKPTQKKPTQKIQVIIMIKKLLSIYFVIFACLSPLFGVIFEVRDLNKFEEMSRNLDGRTLVLFDVDYTLLSPKDISLKPCGKGFRRKFLHVLDPKRREYLQSILALESEEELMDCSFPSMIQRMQKDNIHVIGLTALETGEYGKIDHLEDWRIKQLKKFNIDFSSAFYNYNPIVLSESKPYNGHYPLFKNGVLFTNRQPKGKVLVAFMKRVGWMPNKILFIDDSMEQLKSVESAAQALGVEFIGFHYIAAAEIVSSEFDQAIGEFQFKNLVEKEHWFPEAEVKVILEKQACDPMKKSIQIIYINGPSSSGKTTLAQALQQEFDVPFLHIGIDRVIGMMPNKLINWEGGPAPLGFSWKSAVDETGTPVHEIQAGPFGKKMVETLKEIVLTMVRMGHHVIVDDVSFGKCEVDEWREALKDCKVLWVGIKAPLNILEAREKVRGNRMHGSARAQYFKVHKDVVYDIEFDTSKDSLTTIVQSIKEHLGGVSPKLSL